MNRSTRQRVLYSSLIVLAGIAFLHHNLSNKCKIIQEKPRLTNPVPDAETVEESVRRLHKPIHNVKNKHSGDSDAYFMRRKIRVTPLDYVFTTRGPSVCPPGNAATPLMVVLIMTVHDHVTERQAIRETWGSVVKSRKWGEHLIPANIVIIFMLGNPKNSSKSYLVMKENEEFHDIVEADFTESYYNLTYKVLMGYKWVKQFCSSAKYILKVDEDTFLNVNLLVNTIQTMDLRNTVLGPFFSSAVVTREGKHRLSKESYHFEKYPPHVKGNFYVMSAKLAFKVLEAAEFMPYVCIEDAHITGILMKVVGGKHVGVSASAYRPYQTGSPGVCEFVQPSKLAAQKVTPDLARRMWETILGKRKCKQY